MPPFESGAAAFKRNSTRAAPAAPAVAVRHCGTAPARPRPRPRAGVHAGAGDGTGARTGARGRDGGLCSRQDAWLTELMLKSATRTGGIAARVK
jgi:hypothetical protein